MIEYNVKVHPNGDKRWYLNGKRHREDGPAVDYANGEKYWYLNGVYHREDGPAVEWPDGTKQWYLNGNHYSEEEYSKKTKKTIVIDGKTYNADQVRERLAKLNPLK